MTLAREAGCRDRRRPVAAGRQAFRREAGEAGGGSYDGGSKVNLRRRFSGTGKGVVLGASLLALGIPIASGAPPPEPTPPAPSVLEVAEDRVVSTGGPDAPLVEPHLSIDPRNADHWLAGAIVISKPDLSAMDCAALATFDGGKTWRRRDLGWSDCADPWTAVLADGTGVLAVLADDKLLVYRSPDGGRTWPFPPVSLGGGHDHETLVLDRTDGEPAGSLYVLSVQSTTEKTTGKRRDAVFVARSDDGGRSFREPTRVVPSNLSFNTMTGAVLSDGTLAVSFSDYERRGPSGPVWLASGRSWLLISADGGATFSAPLWISGACGRSFPSLVADESRGPGRDRLYWVCNGRADGLTPNPDYERILVQFSADRGESWSEPLSINVGSGRRPYVRTAAMAVDRDGIVGVSWYDGRNEREKIKSIFQCTDLFFAASRDGGKTFLPEVRVSTQAGCADSPGNGKARYRWPAGGDYSGLAARPDGGFQLLWADSRDGMYRLRTSTVRVVGAEGR
ncbi:MAG: sialidase family protein [Thermoanaerobaculia bacterium]